MLYIYISIRGIINYKQYFIFFSFPGADENSDEDEGPENFSSLFTLPTEADKDKNYSLYDELLAIELHKREMELAKISS